MKRATKREVDIQPFPVTTIVPQVEALDAIKTGLLVVLFLPDVALFLPRVLHQ